MERFDEGGDAVPHDLDADADEEERGEAEDDVHGRRADGGGEAVGVAVAEVNGHGDDGASDGGDEKFEKAGTEVVEMFRFVGAKGDGDGDGAGTDCQRQSERIEGAVKDIGTRIYGAFGGAMAAFVLTAMLEHAPTCGDDNQSAADLDDGQRDSKERQNESADGVRGDQEKEAVQRDMPSQFFARLARIVESGVQEDRTAADRVHDRKKREHN